MIGNFRLMIGRFWGFVFWFVVRRFRFMICWFWFLVGWFRFMISRFRFLVVGMMS